MYVGRGSGGGSIHAQAADLEKKGLGDALASQNVAGVAVAGQVGEVRRTVKDERNRVLM